MSVYKDKTNGKWKAEVNITGENPHRKRKTGFSTKKEALEWEREYIERFKSSSKIKFETLLKEYLKDFEKRRKEISFINKKQICEKHILPFFKNYKLENITPATIRKYQNDYLLETKLKKTTINLIESHLITILNFAVKFYGLKENVFNKIDKVGNKKTEKEIKIWKIDDFEIFIKHVEKEPFKTVFNLLFFTGMRKGEMLALTVKDIDFKNNIINIDKTYHRIKKKDIITLPKNRSSIRKIKIDNNLSKILKNYILLLYKPHENQRIFKISSETIKKYLYKTIKKTNLKRITLHDFRHSHASFLIHKNINILAVSKRLGHENTTITLKTYAHLYKEDENKIVDLLEAIGERK